MQKEEKRRRRKNAEAWKSSSKLTSSSRRKAQNKFFKFSGRANDKGNLDMDRFEPMDGRSVSGQVSGRERDFKEKRRSQVSVDKRRSLAKGAT